MISPKLSRGFLAVVPPEPVLDAVEQLIRYLVLPIPVRPIPRSKWHLTVRFLGNRVRFDDVRAQLGTLALDSGTVRLAGGGAFPSARRADVLWVGVAEGAAFLTGLAEAVHGLLDPGRPVSEGPHRFHPHVTLARCKTKVDVRAVVRAIGPQPLGPAWSVGEVVLLESHLGRGPAVYEERARFPLR